MSETGKPLTEDPLTIPEAAAQIGVSERTLYRLLKSDNFAARTVTEHRQTVTGRRLTTLLPPDLVREIAEAQPPPVPPSPWAGGQARAEGKNDDNNAANSDTNTDRTALDADNAATDSVPAGEAVETGLLPAVVYQARIADLTAMNAELRADKERLYRLLEMAQGNLAREQALRSLAAPVVGAPPERTGDAGSSATSEAQETAPGSAERCVTGVSGMETPSEATTGYSEAISAQETEDATGAGEGAGETSVTVNGNAQQSWWARLWGK